MTGPSSQPPTATEPPATLLVGTARCVGQLAAMLHLVEDSPRLLGALTQPSREPEASLGIPVLGDLHALPKVLADRAVDRVLVTMPAALADQARAVCRTLSQAGVNWRFIQPLSDQLAGRANGVSGAPLEAAPTAPDPVALIGRMPRPLDEGAIRAMVDGQSVMITGAGGSIGSELARIVARFSPARLVLVERSENALFEIDRQIADAWPGLSRAAVLHDVTDAARTMAVVEEHGPHIVFHAAAHKHVPMMEDHPAAAVENNFFGTRSIADAAAACRAQRFVMISTDKAVNPSSVMGATKRLAELYVQFKGISSDTAFSMVRFGNVLGSACSVLPIWSRQLAEGRPITVTHAEMTRYFMTIPEAAGLVLQSAALAGEHDTGDGGAVFLLDMGDPVRILDLARRFVRLHGLEPDSDVPIAITGPRPGEKLFEELAYDSEDMLPTSHDAVRVWRTQPPTEARMRCVLDAFECLRNPPGEHGHPWQHATHDDILAALRAAVPEMRPAPAPDRPTRALAS